MAINWILFVGGILLAALGLIYVLDVRGVGTRSVISYRENWLWGRSKRWLDSPDGNQVEPSWGCWRLLALETRTELCPQIMELEGLRAVGIRLRRSRRR